MKPLLALLAAALSAGAADFTGNWVGKVELPSGVYQVTLALEQKGEQVSGTIATPNESYPLQKVKLSGGKLSFEVNADQVYVVECVQDQERITGGIKLVDGSTGKLEVARSK